jgi:hypothetical protein
MDFNMRRPLEPDGSLVTCVFDVGRGVANSWPDIV